MSDKISAGGVKKGKNKGQKIVTANRLTDGVVVYRVGTNDWVEDLRAGAIVEGDAAMAALNDALREEPLVCGPYLMDVDAAEGKVVPDGRGRLREEIRFFGPTIHPEFGRFADITDSQEAA